MLLKRHRSTVEVLPHDVVELILERLPMKSLLRFKCVSNQWKSAIESRRFQERHFILTSQSRGSPDVLFVHLNHYGDDGQSLEARSFVFGSSIARTVRFSVSGSMFCHGTCDGLVCVYCVYTPSLVVNPASRWQQTFPLSNVQQLFTNMYTREVYDSPTPKLGFGKDIFRGTYKPVFLYNSTEYGLDNVTTCEVFDFSTNAWRYVLPASPYRVNGYHKPVYLDGSLYWFTECVQPNILSFDLHTETFQVICKTPFTHLCEPLALTMCILDNRLCVSEKKWPTQVIWSFNSSGVSKTWKIMCSIDLTKTSDWFGEPEFALLPIALVEKNKLLLQGRDSYEPRVIHDLHTNSCDLLFKPIKPLGSLYYFESLLSVICSK